MVGKCENVAVGKNIDLTTVDFSYRDIVSADRIFKKKICKKTIEFKVESNGFLGLELV